MLWKRSPAAPNPASSRETRQTVGEADSTSWQLESAAVVSQLQLHSKQILTASVPVLLQDFGRIPRVCVCVCGSLCALRLIPELICLTLSFERNLIMRSLCAPLKFLSARWLVLFFFSLLSLHMATLRVFGFTFPLECTVLHKRTLQSHTQLSRRWRIMQRSCRVRWCADK